MSSGRTQQSDVGALRPGAGEAGAGEPAVATGPGVVGPGQSPLRGRRRRRRALYASSVVAVLLMILIAVLATRSVAPGTVTESSLGGRMAPPVAGTNLVTGQHLSLASLRGRYVLVDFFASWCGACQTEAPQIEAFLFAHRNQHDVAVLAVDSTSDTVGDARAFLRQTGATYPAILDPGGRIADAYGVASPPQSFLVAPNGRVIAWIPGGVVAAKLDPLVAGERLR